MPALRDELGRRAARLRSLGVRDALRIEPDTLFRLIKATLAATVSWEVATLLDSPRPVLASLGAVLVVQVTVRSSLSRSVQLTIGVTVGLAISILIGHFLGQHWWSIGLVVLGGLVLGEILRLGPFSSQAAISALLAFSLGSNYGLLRIVDTTIGAIIGVAVNALIAPPTYLDASARAVRGVAEDIGALLRDMGAGLTDGAFPADEDGSRWLARARDVTDRLTAAGATLQQAEESLTFNHRRRRRRPYAERVTEARTALEHVVNQLRGLARTLTELAAASPDAPDSREAGAAVTTLLGPLLARGGDAVAAFGRLQETPGSTPDREDLADAVRAAAEDRDVAADALADLDTHGGVDPVVARLLASLLVDAERLVSEVGPDGAHATALSTR